MAEEQEQEIPVVAEAPQEEQKPLSYDDGVIRVNLDELNKPAEEVVTTPDVVVNEVIEAPVEGVEETPQQPEPVQVEESFIEEITNEEVQEQVQDLAEEIKEAVEYEQVTGAELPDNIQKVVEFMNDTGGSLEDYVKLNTDYASLNEGQLLREYYESTKPHLDREEIDFLMEDNFSYVEELDEDRDIRKKKIAQKEELAKAKNHLEGLKTKYYDEVKAGVNLNPEQQKAVEFFNRYSEENEAATKVAESQVSVFKNKTEKLFTDDFKGFDFNVGEKKFRFKVNNADQVKDTQSDINNLVKKFLNDKNEMSDAAGYHKSLFTAMNADKIANHFYEQGKADAMKTSVQKAKNIDMGPRGTHEKVSDNSGFSVKAVPSKSTNKYGFKIKK
jgi:hypothetical protein